MFHGQKGYEEDKMRRVEERQQRKGKETENSEVCEDVSKISRAEIDKFSYLRRESLYWFVVRFVIDELKSNYYIVRYSYGQTELKSDSYIVRYYYWTIQER